jgi:hypothetical protein
MFVRGNEEVRMNASAITTLDRVCISRRKILPRRLKSDTFGAVRAVSYTSCREKKRARRPHESSSPLPRRFAVPRTCSELDAGGGFAGDQPPSDCVSLIR